MQYYAHVRTSEPDGEPVYQTVTAHLMGTAALCRAFAADFGAANEGEMAGLAHDIGKYTPGFQHRLLDNGPIVDHATAGAIACARQNHGLIAACVAGHHGGLQNVGNVHTDQARDNTLYGRLKKGIAENYLEQCDPSSICLPQIPPRTMQDKLQASFWIRMLYSCLVDADFLDTEQFMQGDRGRGVYDSMETLFARLQTYIRPWQNPTTTLNRLRCDILSACMEAGSKPKGIYTLTVPTGGGKTVASLAFALRHALTHKMRRIVYVIPYTSIIEQNASVFQDILGRQNVLEHHSGVQFDLSDGAPLEQIAKALASENWDMPVIVTTAVQLFESMYANRSSRCRKLHNLANSVIIFDEYEIIGLNLKSQLNQGFRGLVLFLLTLKIADKAIHRRQYAQNRNLSAERGAASLCSASTRHTLPTYISFRRSTELSARVDLHRLPLRHSTHVPVARAA